MGHEKRIVDAFASNGIARVLLIDDVYDPPDIDETWAGALMDHMQDPAGRGTAKSCGLNDGVIDDAIQALGTNDMERDSLARVVSALYGAYARTGNAAYDPGQRFRAIKQAGLDAVGPLVRLLRQCGGSLDVRMAGLGDGEQAFADFKPDVLFLDYFLSSDVPVSGKVSAGAQAAARKESIELLRRLLGSGLDFAVVLMSSRDQKGNADGYRRQADEQRVLAVRFRFLRKSWIKPGKKQLEISHEAADALLDTTQGFRFGGVLQKALKTWQSGAEDAIKALMREVADLEPKDFAYLMRFRLHEEGEMMSHYLEWLFGETLRALTDERVDWRDESFGALDDASLSKGIEGAFDGPSLRIATMFHRIRINGYGNREQNRDELGDLYVDEAHATIRAVVTPDCDLVPRNGRPKVASLLTMGGAIRSFDQKSTSADHFLLRNGKAYSVKWNPKDLRSFPLRGEGTIEKEPGHEYAGTLRPLYAQEMQRIAIADLARLGLPVSPAIGVDARVRVFIRIKQGEATTTFRDVDVPGDAIATIMLGRGGGEKGHVVLLRRRFLHHLADALRKINPEDLDEHDRVRLRTFLLDSKESERANGFLGKGATTVEAGPLGTRFLIAAKPENKADSAWLQFLLSLDDEAMQDLLAIDPLVVIEEADDPSAPVAGPTRVPEAAPTADPA